MNKIIQGDCLEKLKELEDNSIDCVVTSPPYWALRDYGVDGQIGLESNPQEYINNLCNIFDEIKRVLKKDGTCWVNIGDTYGGSGKGATGYSSKSTLRGGNINDNEKYRKVAKESWNFNKAPKTKGDVSKSLCQIPSRFAIEMANRGWILRNKIIWHKPNAMPSSVKDRFTVDFEEVFFFVKNKNYYFETQFEPTVEPYSEKRSKRPETSLMKADYIKGKAGNFTYNKLRPQGRNKRTVWSINTKPLKEAHFATYPETLVEPMIKAGCPKGGVVLDPFFGAGTTGLVAKKQCKNYIGIELNPKYIKIANERINSWEKEKAGDHKSYKSE
jgi:DNA modification methylase